MKMGGVPKEAGGEGTQSPGQRSASVTHSEVIHIYVEEERALRAKGEGDRDRANNIYI